MKPDIQSREDVIQLIDRFYGKVNHDKILSPYFNEAANVDWETHLPKMYDFWETVLFAKALYRGNPLAKHKVLDAIMKLTPEAFQRWLKLFHGTVDELFEGKIAGLEPSGAKDSL
ncbi:MAG: group III truncated hemoglobin [Proteobacteria bacterium]|jgi:hemoglobin|nr:group III truncated hemoglobin [Pseudomonadota bacterium]